MPEIEDKFAYDIDERNSAKRDLKKRYGLNKILGKSRTVKEIHNKIDLISSCDVSVLISGESGTGKELAARAIHHLSPRCGKPFIPVNCSAIPDNLIENELFGHIKGAFTDACYHQNGLVKEAEGGTLFLDEIGTISPFVQIKFLRLLQDLEYKPLGDSKIHKADIRIIAATNKPLLNLVTEGTFRQDLYYRLNIVTVHIPPLRNRKEDIPLLVEHFMNKYSEKYNKKIKKISAEAMDVLMSDEWTGNIRELENKIQQLTVISTSTTIIAQDVLPERNRDIDNAQGLGLFKIEKKSAVNTFEKNYLAKLLIQHKGNVSHAARMTGKSRTALWNLIKKHNISPKIYSQQQKSDRIANS